MTESSGSNQNGSTEQNRAAASIEVVDASSRPNALNGILWFLGCALILAAALVPSQLPQLIAQGRELWVKALVMCVLALVGIGLLLATTQGRGFFSLLKDVQVELRRVTWPGKEETIEYTWKVIVLMLISGLLVWALDAILTPLIKAIIG